MNIRNITRAAMVAASLLLALVAGSCGKKAGVFELIPNERPRVSLTAAPVNEADTAYYAYKISWSGYDPDGRVQYYLYAIDPKGGALPETTWIRTTKNAETIFFRASNPDTNSGPTYEANEYHVFVIKAVDDDNEQSLLQSRAFFSFTMAPIVNVVNPRPSHLGARLVTPSVRITWEGRDEDGVFTQKPVKYKYRMLSPGDPEFPSDRAKLDPNGARRYFASTNFAGWDSTSAETTFAQFTNLTPSQGNGAYVFIVVGFDEAGAFSADWSLDNNMLEMSVGFAGTLGPRLTFYNEFFNYTYPSGGYAPNDPLAWVPLEFAADIPLRINWFASPPEGAAIEWYRWRMDGNVDDETPRTNEATDWYHWSQKSVGTSTCTVGPFSVPEGISDGDPHLLYVEAMDNTGIKSIGTIQLLPKRATFDRELLIIDDTRLELDRFLANGTRDSYKKEWPAAAELDTFLYAVGNKVWRHPAPGRAGVSPPGIFSGYSFDTLNTRNGLEIATYGVPLKTLGRYRYLIWMTDPIGAVNTGTPSDVLNAMSTMRYMNTPGRASSLASYTYAGGKAWVLGGTAAYCSLIEYNAIGTRNNDNLYGPGNRIFSSSAGELAPGRMMYDGARWQSEMSQSTVSTTVQKSPRAIGGWTHPGQNYVGTYTAPDYSFLPTPLRRRLNPANFPGSPDTLPPTRPNTALGRAAFYSTSALPYEYMTQPNIILEDGDADPLLTREIATLDTLYELSGGALATNATGYRPVSMTYYHGIAAPQFVFSGFSIWDWTRTDCIGLVDFVLQRIWGLSRAPVDRLAPPTLQSRAGAAPIAVQKPATTRLPVSRTRE